MYRNVLFFLIGLLVSGGYVWAAAVVSDDFSTNPASRWTATEQGGTYPWFWTDTTTPPVGGMGLPAAEAGSMYTFSESWKRMMTNDTTSVTQSYTVSTDFKVKGSPLGAWYFGQYALRQGTDPAQCWDAGFYVGGNGAVLPQGKYSGGGWSTANLGLDRWYTLITSVEFGASLTSMQSQIVDKVTGAVIYSTAVYSDSSPSRPMDSKGFGFYAGLDGQNYWGQAVLADNFIVETVEIPAGSIIWDDFSTDAFASRWTNTFQDGTYPWLWAAVGWDPNTALGGGVAGTLPKPGLEAPCMYTFSEGWKRMWTNDTTSITKSYVVSTDFKVKGSPLGAWYFGQYAQRQGTDPAQCWDAGFYVGGDGSVLPQGKFAGGTWSVAKLGLDRWYTLITSVNIGTTSSGMQSQLVDKLTQEVIYITGVYSDSSPSRPINSKGFGFYAGLDGSNYWGQAVLADNFGVYNNTLLAGDISGSAGLPDRVVDLFDVDKLASEWLKCSYPGAVGCEVVPAAYPGGVDRTVIGDVVVDGDLSEWGSARWIPLSTLYYDESARDVNTVNTKFAVKWQKDNDNAYSSAGTLYVAVQVEDGNHVFTADSADWNSSDRVEVYVKGDQWATGTYYDFAKAQQYIVGIKPSMADIWSVLGPSATPGPVPASANFQAAASVSGALLNYEMAIRVFDSYDTTGAASILSQLRGSQSIGVDVVVDSKDFTTYDFVMYSANGVTGKAADAGAIALHKLESGCLVSDINQNFKVDFSDFALMAADWLKSL